MSRTIVIGDIHGCARELRLLLDKLDIGPDDTLISLGDVVDKGPDCVGALRYLMEAGALIVRGNHEDPYIRYHKQGLSIADIKSKDVKDERKVEWIKLAGTPEMAWLAKNASIYIETTIQGQLFTFTHAGVVPYIDLYDVKKHQIGEAIRVRYLDADTHGFIRMVKIDKDKYPDEVASWKPEHDNVVEWQKVYNKEYGIVVHGHIIVGPNPVFWLTDIDGETARVEINAMGTKIYPIDQETLQISHVKAISLDTGAHKGWNLTAMIIEEDSGDIYFEQVEVPICYEP